LNEEKIIIFFDPRNQSKGILNLIPSLQSAGILFEIKDNLRMREPILLTEQKHAEIGFTNIQNYLNIPTLVK